MIIQLQRIFKFPLRNVLISISISHIYYLNENLNICDKVCSYDLKYEMHSQIIHLYRSNPGYVLLTQITSHDNGQLQI